MSRRSARRRPISSAPCVSWSRFLPSRARPRTVGDRAPRWPPPPPGAAAVRLRLPSAPQIRKSRKKTGSLGIGGRAMAPFNFGQLKFLKALTEALFHGAEMAISADQVVANVTDLFAKVAGHTRKR